MIPESNISRDSPSSSPDENGVTFTNDHQSAQITTNVENSNTSKCDHTLRSGRTIETSIKEKHSTRNYVKLIHTSKVADRFHLSSAAVAAVGSAVLMDYEIVDPASTKHVIDPNKVRRQRELQRNAAFNLQQKNREPIFSLYFDGRNDLSMTFEHNQITMKKQHHISLLQQPGSYYIGHATIDGHGSYTVLQGIKSFFSKYSIPITDIMAIGCDGCVENTGRFGGTIAYLESELGHSLQWIICLLHFNELPLRHLILEHDRVTKGPKTFDGPIGKLLQNCELRPLVQFEKIQFDCNVKNISEISKTVSWEQNYLYHICTAISNGVCDKELEKQFPGKISHSRFITMANRLCRLYVSTTNPSSLLIILVKYVLRVYAPAHFNIKYQSSCIFGPIHLANIIQTSRFLTGKHLKTVQQTIARNAFFVHPENISLTMLCDENKNVRYLGWKKILRIRKSSSNEKVRTFNLPRLNFNGNHYTEIIDLEQEAKTVPPILRKFEFCSNDANYYAKKKLNKYNLEFDFAKLPCHTQSVERCVKIVTEASKSVCGEERRN